MTHRKFALFIGAYVVATALMAWFAYFLGSTQGLSAAPLPQDPRERAAYVNTTDNIWSCDLFRGFPGMRGNDFERACGDGAALRLGAAAGPLALAHGGAPKRLAGSGPLDKAVALRIAGSGPSGNSRLDVPPATTLDAVLNQPAPLGAMLAAANNNSLTPPPAGLPSSLPGVLLSGAGGPSFTPPDGDDPLPPPPEVPLPAGLPLMLTGLGGVLALARRRRAAA
ncbi:MAG: hypothetical protein R3C54_06450 [Parvularculaceae bacterium]